MKHVCALYQLHACDRHKTKILGTKQSKGLQGSMEKAVAGRAIQERFESDSRAIRSDLENLNEKCMIFVWVLAKGVKRFERPQLPLV